MDGGDPAVVIIIITIIAGVADVALVWLADAVLYIAADSRNCTVLVVAVAGIGLVLILRLLVLFMVGL